MKNDDLRETNTGRLLLRAMRAFNERSMTAVRELGHSQLTFAHAAVLPHIREDGSRLTDIAEHAGLRKQSAAQLVAELEEAGYVTREPDPTDKRAVLIRFTAQGQTFLEHAADAKREIETWLEEQYGPQDYARLRELLSRFPGIRR